MRKQIKIVLRIVCPLGKLYEGMFNEKSNTSISFASPGRSRLKSNFRSKLTATPPTETVKNNTRWCQNRLYKKNAAIPRVNAKITSLEPKAEIKVITEWTNPPSFVSDQSSIHLSKGNPPAEKVHTAIPINATKKLMIRIPKGLFFILQTPFIT